MDRIPGSNEAWRLVHLEQKRPSPFSVGREKLAALPACPQQFQYHHHQGLETFSLPPMASTGLCLCTAPLASVPVPQTHLAFAERPASTPGKVVSAAGYQTFGREPHPSPEET